MSTPASPHFAPASPVQVAPVFSIVTVCLNPGQRLGETLESVLMQSFAGFEVIIKDGGSRDGSLGAVSPDPRVCICSTPDAGIYDAMNQALPLCRGDYVMFLNAGDCLHSRDVLAVVAQNIQHYGPVPLLFGDYFNLEYGCFVRSPIKLSRQRLFRNLLCHQSYFVERSVFTSVGAFDTSYKMLADYDMLARILLRSALPYRHLGLTVANYLGEGASRKPGNLRLGHFEMARLRRCYYGRWERLLFSSIYACTLPSARNYLMTSPRCRALWPLYTRAANLHTRLWRAL